MPKRKSEEFEVEEVEEKPVEAVIPSHKKKQTGKIILVTKTRILVEYGDGLGTSIEYNEKIHSNLKPGDSIDFP